MPDTYELQIGKGRVTGTLVSGRAGAPIKAEWNVPQKTPDQSNRIVQKLARDPLLSGRFSDGGTTEEDRNRLGLREEDWESTCNCGMKQPCRHAQSVLFEFRREAKLKPQLWLKASGIDPEETASAVRSIRAEIAQRVAKDSGTSDISKRARLLAGPGAGGDDDPWLLRRLDGPAFWNRDVPFAEWLRPIIHAVQAKEERG